jgi:aspartyl-tRNA(Asn)/glutamyl-tRNA(Gln) amidotransferase subunit C
MERITKKEVFKLAEQLMLRLSDEEAENIIAEFDTLLKQLDLLNQIDTSNVSEMIYPFEEPTSFSEKTSSIMYCRLKMHYTMPR